MCETSRENTKYRWQMTQFILILAVALCSYIALHLSMRSGKGTHGDGASDSDVCLTREGHYSGQSEEERAWKQMKWIGQAAPCKVKGHLIEKLDPVNDFRRGFALKFAANVEDKTHLLSWLLASRTGELGTRRRRVYLDLGANSFASSVDWFLRMYPCDFTEVHAFEIDASFWRLPPVVFDEDANLLPAHVPRWNAVRVNSTPSVPQWMMERVTVHYQLASDRDDPPTKSIDISRFIKEELRLTAADTVVVKMDIEGAEWSILGKWMEDPEMPLIVDELFVEVHYASPTMSAFGWDVFAPHSRDDASRLMADLRWHGFYAHFWP